jgi:CheY-like chemotaxis protein
MPEMDGLSACIAVRALDRGLPVVILSGLVTEPMRLRLEEAGAHAILGKPCDLPTLRRAIAGAMDARARSAQA